MYRLPGWFRSSLLRINSCCLGCLIRVRLCACVGVLQRFCAGESSAVERNGGGDAAEACVAVGAGAGRWAPAADVYDVDEWFAGAHLLYHDGRLLVQNTGHVFLGNVCKLCTD